MALLMGDVRPEDWDELDNNLAAIQVWAGKVDGLNAAERLTELATGIASLPTVQVGFGGLWFTNTPPTGYLICDGTAISRTIYANLFNELGVTWGAGNGSTTFNLPDLRLRFPLGKATSGSGSTLTSTGGSFDHTHTGPSHTHGAGSYEASGQTDSTTLDDEQIYESGVNATATFDGAHSHSVDISVSGSSAAGGTGATGTNNPPYVVVNFIIKY